MTTLDPSTVAGHQLNELERAWNRADGNAYGDAFADDTDFVDIRGTHHRGRAAVGAGHQALFDSIYSGSTIRYQLDTARLIAPGCVVAVARATLTTPRGPIPGVNHSRLTAVLTQHDRTWSVTAFHNALVLEAA
jgi:uncharacterized protein (TIGR02246 family)